MNYSISIEDTVNIDAGRFHQRITGSDPEAPMEKMIGWTQNQQITPLIHPDNMTDEQRRKFSELARKWHDERIAKANERYGHVPDEAADALMTIFESASPPEPPQADTIGWHLLTMLRSHKQGRAVMFAATDYDHELEIQLRVGLDAKRVLASTESIIIADSPTMAALRLYMDGRSDLLMKAGEDRRRAIVISPDALGSDEALDALDALSKHYPITHDTRIAPLFAPNERMPDELAWKISCQEVASGMLTSMYWDYVEHDRVFASSVTVPPAIDKLWMEYAAASLILRESDEASDSANAALAMLREYLREVISEHDKMSSLSWKISKESYDVLPPSDEAKVCAKALDAGNKLWDAFDGDDMELLFDAAEMDVSAEDLADLAEQIVSESEMLSAFRRDLVRDLL